MSLQVHECDSKPSEMYNVNKLNDKVPISVSQFKCQEVRVMGHNHNLCWMLGLEMGFAAFIDIRTNYFLTRYCNTSEKETVLLSNTRDKLMWLCPDFSYLPH